MPQDIPAQLWKMATTTVGLVSVRHDSEVNVMSAEWAYFVNKDPLYAAVVLSPRSASRGLIESIGEFSVTLCSEDQPEIADFAGSFSVETIDKTASELITFGEPRAVKSPWVEGGVVGLECVLRETVPFPVHTMYVGEVVAVHLPEENRRPLVKHGGMHALGEPLRRTAVVATAQLVEDEVLRVAATGPAADGADEADEWRISLLTPDGETVDLGRHPSAEYGDFLVDLPLPVDPARLTGGRIKVERPGARPGYARLGTTLRR
ncbi:flavin reductase family protein [Streptomyces sp. NPDC002643]